MHKYLLRDNGSFVIQDYNRLHPFSDFLPGIAGEFGIPLWVFYVNRAQGVVSFGIQDKNHAILEFYPADKAYASVSRFGFRTFIKINSRACYEPFMFQPGSRKQEEMVVKSADFKIREVNPEAGLIITVKYFTLPNTPVGGMVRQVSIRNISKERLKLEVLDGLPRVVPFGAAHFFLKDMSRTLEAWMYSFVHDNLAMFRIIVDPRDVSQTRYIEGANFNYSFFEAKGRKVSPDLIVDPAVIFSQDTSYVYPVNFIEKSFRTPFSQVTRGRVPCAFSHFRWNLSPGQEQTFYSLFGTAFKASTAEKFTNSLNSSFLQNKAEENCRIIENIKDRALCISGSKSLNHYLKNTYLDNVLRGGYPYCPELNACNIKLNGNAESGEPYYIFSRKHGDLERDYNHFQLLPAYFSEGEANYRDINQNRRMDLFFEPSLGAKNIKYFLDFLKIDGYNPLVVKGEKLYLDKIKARRILKAFGVRNQKVTGLMVKGFYLGEIFRLLEDEKIRISRKKELAASLLKEAKRLPQAHFGEGYWIDHWRYNLDLIENFLYFYPDRLKELFLDQKFVFWDDEYQVKKRSRRYHLRSGKVYQGESIEAVKEKKIILKTRGEPKNFLRTRKGKIYETNLIGKLLTLILNKAATLDPAGIGIEMEADKPGWCDSLNGLPAVFGSSLCETLELKRAVKLLISAIKQLSQDGITSIFVAKETHSFLNKLNSLITGYLAAASQNRDYSFWNKSNRLKEDFRQKTFLTITGEERRTNFKQLETFLSNLISKLDIGINKAIDKKTRLYFTYFTYEVKKFRPQNKHIVPYAFTKRPLPLFLEGVMHALRTEGKKNIPALLKRSELFDKKLKMYRLNASLEKESVEIGRSRVFVPGWLENASIWLHMEYKYLLELLKRGFYTEFFTAFSNCGICFLDPRRYGRSILENSSFIVSSAHPDNSLWGKGFVARLSGATAEFLNIWAILCLGSRPFILDKHNNLCLRLAPVLKKEFFTQNLQTISFNSSKVTLPKNTFSFKIFSKTLVVYHNPQRKDTYSQDCRIIKTTVRTHTGETVHFSNLIRPPWSLALRNQKLERIDVYLE